MLGTDVAVFVSVVRCLRIGHAAFEQIILDVNASRKAFCSKWSSVSRTMASRRTSDVSQMEVSPAVGDTATSATRRSASVPDYQSTN